MLDLSTLAQGDRVQHELMVRSREDKTTRNGDPFAVLRLGNASGQISANIWKEQLPWIEGVKPGSIIQVIGAIDTYQGQQQLRLTAPVRTLAASAANLDEFLPRIHVDTAQLWDQVDRWRGEIHSAKLRAALDLFFSDDAFRAAFEKVPGAPRGRHAQIGGLLLHVVEVATIARASASTMGASVDLVTVAALLHDIGKVDAFAISAAGFDYTPAGLLLGHATLGSLMLDRRLRTLPAGMLSESQELELHHFIQSHHGPEHGAAVRPRTIEAEMLHWADQTSASGSSFADSTHDWS